MKVAFALTALSLLGLAIALPTPVEKREKAYDGGYTVGAKRDAQPEKAANIFYAVGPEKREAEKALDGEYTVGVKRDAQPEEATNIFYAVE